MNKLCPFCKGNCDPEGWLRNDGKRGPECDGCGATAPTLEIWNTRAEPAQPVLDWQPIETAPRDGTKIFIYAEGWEYAPIASWEIFEGGDEITGEGMMCGWACVYDHFFEDGWITDDYKQPTHWLPMREAHAKTKQSPKGDA